MGKFSDTLMDHFTSPRNVGAMESADAVGQAGALGQGPFMALYLRLLEGRVVEAKYQTFGCGVSIACGSVLTVLVTGRAIGDCLKLTPDDVADALQGVPSDKAHCPILAIEALREALKAFVGVVEATPGGDSARIGLVGHL